MTQEAKVIVGIGLATLLILVVGVLFLSKNDQQSASTPSADQAILMRNIKHKAGAEKADVTIVEFGDFQCPACGRTYPIIKRILEENKNKITFVYRHFPLPQHKNALLAARAAEAAGSQGKFWEMHDLLFMRQETWSESSEASKIFTSYAEELKLNIDRFSENFSSKTYDAAIQSDKDDGIRLGVNSTPTLFINNKKVTVAPTYENLKNLIDSR